MKHIKRFNSILEDNEHSEIKSLMSKLNVSESYLESLIIDLIDLNYSYRYEALYIGENGLSDTNLGIGSHTPLLEIILKREVDDRDPLNWNGSIYYESEDNVISSIYYTISNIKSMLKNNKVLYSIRGLNEIIIRIVFDDVVIENKQPTTKDARDFFKKVNKQHSDRYNVSEIDRDDINTFFIVEEGVSTQNEINFEISNTNEILRALYKDNYSEKDKSESNYYIKRLLDNGSNIEDIESVIDIICNKYFNKIKSKVSNIKMIKEDNIYKIIPNDSGNWAIYIEVSDEDMNQINITTGSIFNKKTNKIDLHTYSYTLSYRIDGKKVYLPYY